MEINKDEENVEFDLVALFLEKGEEKTLSGMAAIKEAIKIAEENNSAVFFSDNINESKAEDLAVRIFVSGGLDKFFAYLERMSRSFESIYFISTRENEEKVGKLYLLKIPQIKYLNYRHRRKSKK